MSLIGTTSAQSHQSVVIKTRHTIYSLVQHDLHLATYAIQAETRSDLALRYRHFMDILIILGKTVIMT